MADMPRALILPQDRFCETIYERLMDYLKYAVEKKNTRAQHVAEGMVMVLQDIVILQAYMRLHDTSIPKACDFRQFVSECFAAVHETQPEELE